MLSFTLVCTFKKHIQAANKPSTPFNCIFKNLRIFSHVVVVVQKLKIYTYLNIFIRDECLDHWKTKGL